MMVTLPPCWLASTSIAEPATVTESTMGARSRRTVIPGTASAAAMDLSAKPGAVITSLEPSGKEHAKAPSGEGKLRSTPSGVTMETRAPVTRAPVGSTIVPFTSAAERQTEKNRQ
jgi:hypothetical protein